MMTAEKVEENRCRMCGKCCSMEIPLTLLDIHRIAAFQNREEKEIFESAVQARISPLTSLFMIRKDETGGCVFLSKENGCTIHEAKPNICSFYSCGLAREGEVMPWTATCKTPSQRARLWEQSMAVMVTRAYLEKNGPVWNDVDCRAALAGIFEHTLVRKTQKLKLARDGQGRPMSMIYDCSRCEKRGAGAGETPVTLDDIQRISAYLAVDIDAFFSKYIASSPSSLTGGLKLKRSVRCIFFDAETSCRVGDVKPMHCRFIPCPKRTRSPEMMDAFYLGSGTLDQQYRHQVALAVTREYVGRHGTGYDPDGFLKAVSDMQRPAGSAFEMKTFCKQIARYRYVDDTRALLAG